MEKLVKKSCFARTNSIYLLLNTRLN